MPMQATTTTPLFAAALKPESAPHLLGGWLAYGLAAVAALPLAVLIPEALLPTAAAFGLGGAGLTALSLRQSRHSRMTQQVTLWVDQLEIATTDGKGTRSLRRFDPKGVRLLLERDDNEQVVRLQLRADTETCELGAFLKPADRASFARVFGTALRRARQLG